MRASIRIALPLFFCAPWAFAQLTDVGVSQTGPTSAAVNTDINYAITVNNDGTTVATSVVLTDTLTAGLSFTSLAQSSGPTFTCMPPASGTITTGGTSFTCSIDSLSSGAVAVFSLTLHIPPGTAGGTEFTNTVNVTDVGDENSENDTVGAGTMVGTPTADVGVLKTAADQAAPGTSLTYSITVVNAGPNAAANVTLTDPLPDNLTFAGISQSSGPAFGCSNPAVGSGGTVTCSLASMAAGATATFSLITNVPHGTGSGTLYTNVATVATATFDPDPDDNSANISTTVSNSDVSVTNTAPAATTVGSTVSFTLTVQNNGPDQATAVVLTDALPPVTSFVSLTQTSGPSFSCSTPVAGSSGTVACSETTVASGRSAVFVLSITVNGAPGSLTISDTAAVTSDTGDPNLANNSSTAHTTLPNPPGVPTLSGAGLWLLGLAIRSAGWVALRREAGYMKN